MVGGPPRIRRMTYRDTASVMRIDAGQWCSALTYRDIDAYTREIANLRGLVIEQGSRLVGFALLSHPRYDLAIDGFLIGSDHRRQGFGGVLLRRVISEAVRRDKIRVTVAVNDKNLGAQLFFSKSGLDRSRVVQNSAKKLDVYLLWKDLV